MPGHTSGGVLRTQANQFRNRRTGILVPAGVPYHIHPDRGPMQGAQHNPNIPGGQPGHRFLHPTNGNGRQTTSMNQPSPQRNMGRTSGYNQGGHVHMNAHTHTVYNPNDGTVYNTGPQSGGQLLTHEATVPGMHRHPQVPSNMTRGRRMRRGRMKGELVSLGNGNYRWNGNGPAPTIHIECTDAGGNNTMADCTPYSAEISGQEGSSAGSAYGDTGGAHHYELGQYHGCPQCPPGQQTHIHY